MRRAGAAAGLERGGLDGSLIERGFRAAIGEAVCHVGATAPNPPVGCVILDSAGAILAAAAHHRAGEPHAEALALRLCRERRLLDQAATAIVTLEPCNHTGRTPPCTEAILASPISTVWIGSADPNPRVAGGGAARLRAAGLSVHCLEPDSEAGHDCAALIAPFARATRDGRPWITVKQALDAAGGMVPPAGARTFTGPEALLLAHRLRRACDAIITGVGTIVADNPLFTVRHVADHPHRRRILAVPDRGGGVSDAYRLDAEARGLSLRTAPDLRALIASLSQEGVLWALVEAGPRLLRAIQRDDLWDDWLTIRQDKAGHDHVEWRGKRTATPLRLIDPALTGHAPKGTPCSAAS